MPKSAIPCCAKIIILRNNPWRQRISSYLQALKMDTHSDKKQKENISKTEINLERYAIDLDGMRYFHFDKPFVCIFQLFFNKEVTKIEKKGLQMLKKATFFAKNRMLWNQHKDCVLWNDHKPTNDWDCKNLSMLFSIGSISMKLKAIVSFERVFFTYCFRSTPLAIEIFLTRLGVFWEFIQFSSMGFQSLASDNNI